MIRTAVLLALIATPLHAETCPWPKIPRVVTDMSTTFTEDLTFKPLLLVCPADGPCHMEPPRGPVPKETIVCLTPEQNAEAEGWDCDR